MPALHFSLVRLRHQACSFCWQDAEKVRQRRSRFAQKLNVPARVRLGSSLAAALLYELFEHPAAYSDTIIRRMTTAAHRTKAGFFRILLSVITEALHCS